MKRIVISLVMVISFTGVKAQQINDDLKELIHKAFEYFPKIKESELSLEAGNQRLDIAKSAYYPNVALNAGYNYIDPVSRASFPIGPGEMKSISFQPYNNYTATAGFTYPVIDFGRALFYVKKANEELQQSKLAVELNKSQLAAQVASIYYSLAYLDKAIALEDTVLNAMYAHQKVVNSKLRNGDALILDSLTVGSAISEEINRKLSLINLRQKQITLLQYTTNLTSLTLPTAFDFPQWNTAADAGEMVKSSFDYKISESRIKAQQWDIKMNRSNLFPIVSVNASMGYRNGYQPDIEKLVFGTQAGVGIAAPIFYGNKSRNSIHFSKLQLKQLELSQESVRNDFRKNLDNVLNDIRTIAAQIENSNQQIVQSANAAIITQSNYRYGTATYTDVLNAIANKQRAELSKLNLEYQWCLSKIELAKLTAVKYYE